MTEALNEDDEPIRPLPAAPAPVRVRVPAKINAHLGVGPTRPDGFHELTTVYHAISLYDEVTAETANELELVVSPDSSIVGAADVPGVPENLAARAAVALAEATGHSPRVRLTLRKGIPIAGGMAGGSADAAATLVACDALWGTGLSRDQLAEIGAELGSDVPFLLYGGTALGSGRGELVTPVLAKGEWHWVVALADAGISTPAAFAELDRLRAAGTPTSQPTTSQPTASQPTASQPTASQPTDSDSDSDRVRSTSERASSEQALSEQAPSTRRPPPAAGPPHALLGALRDADATELAAALVNDLQPAAISLLPGLRRTLRAGRDAGALAGIVSGSGPTCVFLASSADHAGRVAAELAGVGVARAIRTAHGPVPGARLI